MPIGTVDSYSDLDMDIGFHPISKDIRKKTKESSIKQAVRNLLLTSPGERMFNAEWGCGIRAYLFEPISDTIASEIKDMIITSLNNYEPRVEVIDVVVLPMTGDDGYEIGLYYKLRETTTVISQTVTLAERVR